MSLFHDTPAAASDLLVSVDDLTEWLELDTASMTPAAIANLETAIEIATAAIRAKIGRPIVVTAETVTLDGPAACSFFLPSFPVVAIDQIVEDGVQLNATAYTWSPRLGRVAKADGSRWTSALGGLVVSYTHGYPVGSREREQLGGVCLTKAARILGSRDGRTIRAEQIGTYSVSYNTQFGAAGATGTGWTETEAMILGRFADGRA